MKNNLIKFLWWYTSEEFRNQSNRHTADLGRIIYSMRDWRRWLSMTWLEANTAEKFHKHILKMVSRLESIYNK